MWVTPKFGLCRQMVQLLFTLQLMHSFQRHPSWGRCIAIKSWRHLEHSSLAAVAAEGSRRHKSHPFLPVCGDAHSSMEWAVWVMWVREKWSCFKSFWHVVLADTGRWNDHGWIWWNDVQSIERQQFVACCMWLCHFLHVVVEAASSFRLVLTFEILLKYSWVLGNYIALDPEAMVNCVKMPCFLIQCPTIQSWSCFFTSQSISTNAGWSSSLRSTNVVRKHLEAALQWLFVTCSKLFTA